MYGQVAASAMSGRASEDRPYPTRTSGFLARLLSASRPERTFTVEAVVSATPSIQPSAIAARAPGRDARNAGSSETIISDDTSVRNDTQPRRTTVTGSFEPLPGAESGSMALVSTTAFILRLDPVSEKDLAAALLTRDHGVVRAVVKGGRGASRRAAALQLLTEARVTYFRKEGAELGRIDSIEIVRSAFDLATRPASALLLPYIAESLLTFVPESELGDEMYRLTRHVLDALEAREDPAGAPLAARYFEVWLLRFAWLLPEDAACPACGVPLPEGAVRLAPEIPGLVGP